MGSQTQVRIRVWPVEGEVYSCTQNIDDYAIKTGNDAVPFIPSRRVCGRTDELRKEEYTEETQRAEASAHFKKLHKDNIGIRLVNEMLDKVGPELTFDIDNCVKRFCRAYGYDAHFLRWAEIQALWHKGVPGLEKKRLDGSLGIQ